MAPPAPAELVPSKPMFRLRGSPVVALLVAWLASLGAGEYWLLHYRFAPGGAAAGPAVWPGESSVRPAAGRFTLLLFAHPHCPCSRASLAMLARVVARAEDRADVYVLFVRPAGAPDGWERSGLWSAAAAVPGVRVLADGEGAEALRFGAETSGVALLYDPRLRLTFRGGITSGRGHEGDNAGCSALIERLAGRGQAYREFPVFGCPLFDRD